MKALTAVIDAAAFSSVDRQKLVALVQGGQASDGELSAAATYQSHSSDIIDVLNDLPEKAQSKVDDTRHPESTAAYNFAMLKQSLEDQLAQDNKALERGKTDNVEFAASMAAETADVAEIEKDLASETDTHCSRKVQWPHHERFKRIRSGDHGEEIRQEGNLRRTCTTRFAHFRIMKFGAGAGEDPIAKVKDLITELTKRLQADASSEASHTWYCDAELLETTEKKLDLESDVHCFKFEAVVAKSNFLDGEILALEAELGALSRSQLQMDTMRAE